jgi:hypothetical protein
MEEVVIRFVPVSGGNLKGRRRGREAAALEAAGAALGSLGLVAFGLVVWQMARLTTAARLLLPSPPG